MIDFICYTYLTTAVCAFISWVSFECRFPRKWAARYKLVCYTSFAAMCLVPFLNCVFAWQVFIEYQQRAEYEAKRR